MKKILRFIMTILILVFVIFIINLVKNYMIIKKIFEKNYEFETSLKSYTYEEISTDSSETLKKVVVFQDGFYMCKSYINNELKNIKWFDSNTDRIVEINENNEIIEELIRDSKIDTEFMNFYKNVLITGICKETEKAECINKILKENMFNKISEKDNSYVLKFNDMVIYIDKASNLICKCSFENVVITYDIKNGIETNYNIFEKPYSLYDN
ncbi:MAG: hypothetical protein HFJ45_07965 [Clostridia bacterium]|nr:hypothetical protein [Clostridia bacterium]